MDRANLRANSLPRTLRLALHCRRLPRLPPPLILGSRKRHRPHLQLLLRRAPAARVVDDENLEMTMTLTTRRSMEEHAELFRRRYRQGPRKRCTRKMILAMSPLQHHRHRPRRPPPPPHLLPHRRLRRRRRLQHQLMMLTLTVWRASIPRGLCPPSKTLLGLATCAASSTSKRLQ